jgi:hypothetical protein
MGEVRRPDRGDHPLSAGRTRRVETHHPHVGPIDAGGHEHELERLHERTDRHVRAFTNTTRCLMETVDEEPPRRIDHRGVVGRAAVVEPNGHP